MDWLLNIVLSVLIGALVGWIAGIIMKSKGGFVKNAVVGIVGSVVGGAIAKFFGIGGSLVIELAIALAGACLVLWIVSLVTKK